MSLSFKWYFWDVTFGFRAYLLDKWCFPFECVSFDNWRFLWCVSIRKVHFSFESVPLKIDLFLCECVHLKSDILLCNLYIWEVTFSFEMCLLKKWPVLWNESIWQATFFVMCSFEKSHFIWNVSIWEVTFSFGMCLLVKWPFFAPGLNLSLLLICNWVISHYYYYYTTFSWTCTWTLCSWSTLLHIKWWKEVWDTLLCILMCLHTDYTNPCYQRVWHLHPPSYAKTLFPLLPTIRHPVQLGNYSGYH